MNKGTEIYIIMAYDRNIKFYQTYTEGLALGNSEKQHFDIE